MRRVTNKWHPEGGAESQLLYEEYRDYRVLPYGGGILDQPEWWRRDLRMFRLIDELAELVMKLPKAKPGMKTMDSLTGNSNA